jgi:uncharacterized protein with PQ loop repeat
MSVLSILATGFGSIMGFANMHQAYKIFKRKSAGDVSRITFGTLFLSTIIWTLYGIEIKDFPITFSNGIGVIAAASVLVGCYVYRKK